MQGKHLTHVVYMGMGEPLANYDNVVSSLDLLNKRLHIGYRKITISTVGFPDKIRKLATACRQVNLALSLHATNDISRNKLVPTNEFFTIENIFDACQYHIRKTKRRLTIEYAMINGVNDSAKDAERLAVLLKKMLCHVNLIPLNPTSGYSKQPSPRSVIRQFEQTLAKFGVSSTIRLRRGIDVAAGCGQLSLSKELYK